MRRAWILAAALCWMLGGLCPDSWGAERKLLIAVLDYVTWHDLLSGDADTPTLSHLAENGAVGMMCVRTGRGGGGGYLTIGGGSRASVSGRSTRRNLEGYAFQASERRDTIPASRAFRAYTGWPTGDNAIVHLGIGELLRQNAGVPYPLRLGLLGGTLRRSGLRVACIGNADTPSGVHREAVCIGMDEQGMVELGDVGAGLLRRNHSLPYRLTTDVERLLSVFHRAADVVVLELGETSRAEEYSQLMPPGAARSARLRAIERADLMLGRVVERLAIEDWAVLVITPNIRQPDPGEVLAALTPVVFFRHGKEPGLLASPSTGGGHFAHRLGLVLNTDIAPTVLDYFDLEPPPDVIGQPVARRAPAGDHLARLHFDVVRHDRVEFSRRQLFRVFPVVAAVALWASAFLLVIRDHAPPWARAVARGLLLAVISIPPAMLLVALRPLSAVETAAAAIAGALAIAFIGSWITGWRSGHVLPALVLVGLLAYDLLRGQGMLAWSPLSYSVAGGARFYGIGNEYAGALLGAGLIAASGLLSRRERAAWGEGFAAGLVLVGLVAVIGCPAWGANLGMALGCAIGFAVFALYLWRSRPTGRQLVGALVLALAIAAAVVAVGMFLQGGEGSHIGRWFSRLRSHGWTALAEVAVRKLSMNWLLVRVSLWTEVAVAGLGVLAAAVLARPRSLLSELKDRIWLTPAVLACLAGAAASFLLNDSGILGAALTLLYGAGSLAYVGLAEPPAKPKEAPRS
ncbi:MAG: hypothetical protein JSV79_03760 [Armatimonadota bacterium]|nr:MAG: hypothetical protein JSV79_03760 [Armatimonadota bacterium]